MIEEIKLKGWLWEMFKDYIRKIQRKASTGAPELEDIRKKYQEIFPKGSIKILVEEKVGMIVIFNDLESRETSELAELLEEEKLITYLGKHYGHGKYKINLYDGLTFVATRNFKVEDESLPELWREIVAKNKAEGVEKAGSRWG